VPRHTYTHARRLGRRRSVAFLVHVHYVFPVGPSAAVQPIRGSCTSCFWEFLHGVQAKIPFWHSLAFYCTIRLLSFPRHRTCPSLEVVALRVFSKAGRLCIRLDFFASWLGPTCSTEVSLVCRSRSRCVHDSVVSYLDESYHDQSTHQSSLHAFTVTVTPLPQNNHATYFTALSSEPLLTRVALRLQHALGVTAT
jgi:hypothetical protein